MSARQSESKAARGKAFLVTQWFPPEPAAQALRAARLLKRCGFETEVITGIPNYPTGVVADGYKAIQIKSETLDGFRVHRSPLYPSHDSRASRRILNYVSWALSASLLSAWRMRKADVALVYSSPATAALPAMVANRLFGTPYVLLIQDVWPDSVFSSGFLQGRLSKGIQFLIETFVNASYKWANHVAVISPGMVTLLQERGVSSSKLSLLYNAVDTTILGSRDTSVSRRDLGIPSDAFVLMYAGNHGAAQALDVLIKAVPAGTHGREVHLILVGDGMEKPRLAQLAVETAPGRVHFVEPQARETMASLMRVADAQVVSLAKHPLFEVTMPSKVQGMLAAGEPVLAVAAGDVGRVVSNTQCGVVARPGDPDDVSRCISVLANKTAEELAAMGRAGRAYYEENMADAVGQQRMEILLEGARR